MMTAYERGWYAGRDGHHAKENPYEKGTTNYKEWAAGNNRGLKEHRFRIEAAKRWAKR